MRIRSNIRDYDVHFAETEDFLAEFAWFPQRCYVVDSNVWDHYKDGCLSCLGAGNFPPTSAPTCGRPARTARFPA